MGVPTRAPHPPVDYRVTQTQLEDELPAHEDDHRQVRQSRRGAPTDPSNIQRITRPEREKEKKALNSETSLSVMYRLPVKIQRTFRAFMQKAPQS